MKNQKVSRISFFVSMMVAIVCGCTPNTQLVTARSSTRPVILGPVLNVKGDKVAARSSNELVFDVEEENFESVAQGDYSSKFTLLSGKYDVEMMRLSNDDKDTVIVDELYLGSWGTGLGLVFYYDGAWGGIRGRIQQKKNK